MHAADPSTEQRRSDADSERASLSISLVQPGLKGEDVPSHLSCVTRLGVKGSGIKKNKKTTQNQTEKRRDAEADAGVEREL